MTRAELCRNARAASEAHDHCLNDGNDPQAEAEALRAWGEAIDALHEHDCDLAEAARLERKLTPPRRCQGDTGCLMDPETDACIPGTESDDAGWATREYDRLRALELAGKL